MGKGVRNADMNYKMNVACNKVLSHKEENFTDLRLVFGIRMADRNTYEKTRKKIGI